MLSPTSWLSWTRPLALLASLLLAYGARADIAPDRAKRAKRARPAASPNAAVELTVDGLAPNYVLFTRGGLPGDGPLLDPHLLVMPEIVESGRPLPLGNAARLPALYLMNKIAFEAWRVAHPPVRATQSRDVDELIASAAVVACYLRSANDQVPRDPMYDPEWLSGHTVRLHYTLAEASPTRCVVREVGNAGAGTAQAPAGEKAGGVLGGCTPLSGRSEHGGLMLAVLGVLCLEARRRRAAQRMGAGHGHP